MQGIGTRWAEVCEVDLGFGQGGTVDLPILKKLLNLLLAMWAINGKFLGKVLNHDGHFRNIFVTRMPMHLKQRNIH